MKQMNLSLGNRLSAFAAVAGMIAGLCAVLAGCSPTTPKHDVEFVVQVDTTRFNAPAEQALAVEQTRQILKKRLDRFGARGASVQATNTDQIVIQLQIGSAAEREGAIRLLQESGILEFRLVHKQSEALLAQGEIPQGYRIMSRTNTSLGGGAKLEKYLVKEEAELVGGVKQSRVTHNNMGQPNISFVLDDKAAKTFADVTSQNIGRQLALVLGGELQMAPVIQSSISSGSGVIQVNFTSEEALGLAAAMEAPLVAPTTIVGERTF